MRRPRGRWRASGAALVLLLAAAGASAAEPETFHFWMEAKAHARHSTDLETRLFFPFPPDFIPAGRTDIKQRTVDPGGALELSNVAFLGEGEVSPGVAAKVSVHVLDKYNRNPTSSDERVFVREAWIRFGRRPAALEGERGSPLYVLAGLAPRFSKLETRGLETYGMWATAVGRFENPQLQLGGALGRHVYWRGQAGMGNPLFFRDTNVLAGDNGTPQHVPGSVDPFFESGFPIFYDAKVSDLTTNGRFEWGAGLGVRKGGEDDAPGFRFDGLLWYFHRTLADQARLPGTFYEGDLDLLRGVGFPLPFEGDDKHDLGINVAARAGRFRVDGQLVRQGIAGLVRRGFDLEAAAVFDLPGLFLVGETPIGNWLRPVLRVSIIDNLFDSPREYPALSVKWDWRKYDVGVRMGLLRGVDLTLEYSRHDMIVRDETLHPDEVLVTLRFALRP
jgi:hypothetical protein